MPDWAGKMQLQPPVFQLVVHFERPQRGENFNSAATTIDREL
jgi:hypothetical protein